MKLFSAGRVSNWCITDVGACVVVGIGIVHGIARVIVRGILIDCRDIVESVVVVGDGSFVVLRVVVVGGGGGGIGARR